MRQNISQITRIILIIELVIAAYMVIVLLKSLVESYQIEKYILDFEQRNTEIAAENKKLESELAYFTSPEYQDKIAKQNFGLVNPGEAVLILPYSPKPGTIDLQENQLAKRLLFYENLSTPQKWWHLLNN